jgi:integrase
MAGQRRPDLTVEQARHLLEVIKGERLEAFYVLALTTGLRRGELLGLRWADVDLNSRQLHVRRALQRVGGKLRFVEPKTSTSVRVVVVPKLAVRHLAQHRARQDAERLARGAAWRDHDLVFASSVGTPIEPRNVNRRWDELRERASLDWLRLHDLRHGCATFMMAAGVPARTIMEVVGHSEIGVTMNTYTHVLAQLREDAADAIDRVLGAWLGLATVKALRRSGEAVDLGALGGTRTPNLLIRSKIRLVQIRPPLSIRPAGTPGGRRTGPGRSRLVHSRC